VQAEKEQPMVHNAFDLYLCCKTYHEEFVRRESRRRRQTWRRYQLGRALNWVGNRLSAWGQRLQMPPSVIEYQGN
jgi:hypothetical protein